jgi:hypothetical protein
LSEALGERFIPGFGFDDGEFVVAIDEDVVGDFRFGAFAVALDASGSDAIFAMNFAALDNAPTSRLESGIDVLGACLGFVHFLGLRFFGGGN